MQQPCLDAYFLAPMILCIMASARSASSARMGDGDACALPDDLWPDAAAMTLEEVRAALDALLPAACAPNDSAYYIHTSGSTGRPKCVHHVHSALDWHTHATLIGGGLCLDDDVILQVADCSFDLHIRDIFCGLSFGAHIVTIPPEALLDMDLFRCGSACVRVGCEGGGAHQGMTESCFTAIYFHLTQTNPFFFEYHRCFLPSTKKNVKNTVSHPP
jgi:hypothetical protein